MLRGLDEAMRLRGVGHRNSGVYHRSHKTALDERPDVLPYPGHDGGLLLGGPGSQSRGDDAAPFRQHRAEVELGRTTPLLPDDDEPPADGEGGQIALQIGPTHDVEDDVGTPVASGGV